jgi:hypothetical protein
MPNNTILRDTELLKHLVSATTTREIDGLMASLPVVGEADYLWADTSPKTGWREGYLHWIPVGRDRGNWGRIQLAGEPFNPAAERLINGMEALIELARRLELLLDPNAPQPSSPREAVLRYFQIPRLDLIPGESDPERRHKIDEQMKKLRSQLEIRILYAKKAKEFAMQITDRGIGQAPARVHETLLSLGRTDKADKPYLIGAFGQGGSSAYAASTYSLLLSRRAEEFLDGQTDGIGWTIVKKIQPKGRRDPYYAYLAVDPAGQVPSFQITTGGATSIQHGVTFRHIGYDFGGRGSAVARLPFYALNHVLFNPVLPYDLYALRDKPDPMNGNAYRLASRAAKFRKKGAAVIDKAFQPQQVGEAI